MWFLSKAARKRVHGKCLESVSRTTERVQYSRPGQTATEHNTHTHTHIMWTCVYKNGTYVLHHSISRVHFHFLTHKPREFYITRRGARFLGTRGGYSLNLHAGQVWGSPVAGPLSRGARRRSGRGARVGRRGLRVGIQHWCQGMALLAALANDFVSLACCDWVSSQTAGAAARPILRRAPTALLPSRRRRAYPFHLNRAVS